jgi:hypothetical protein
MLDVLGPVRLRELELWVQSDLAAELAVADKRAAELGALASMLTPLTPALGWSYPTIKQAEYDRRRPQGARPGRRLAAKYGGWKRVCKAAYGLRADGRTRSRSHHAWPAPPRGEPRVKPYTRDEVIRAVRACGLELACRPSSSTYVRWSAAKRRLARVNNTGARIPTIGAIYRHFPAGAKGERWRRVLEAAALTEDELRRAYARRIGSITAEGAPSRQFTFAGR